jgi:phage FluMu protein gp41
MSLAAKITALLEGFSVQQIRGLTSADRLRLSQAAERLLRDCIQEDAAAAPVPKSGILRDLKGGDRSE